MTAEMLATMTLLRHQEHQAEDRCRKRMDDVQGVRETCELWMVDGGWKEFEECVGRKNEKGRRRGWTGYL